MYNLKNQYKFLFNEELVVLKRNKYDYEDEIFDIEFDESNGITKGEKFNIVNKNAEELINIASKYSSANKPEIHDYILKKLNDDFKFRIDINSMDNNQVIKHLNENFKDIIYWQGKGNGQNQIGRGEAIVHLAFESNTSVSEPDFVSKNNNKKYSIKSFIKPDLKSHSQVRTKTSFGPKIDNEINNLKNILGVKEDFLSLDFIKKIISNDNSDSKFKFKIKIKDDIKSFNSSCFLLVLKHFILDSTEFDKNQKIEKLKKVERSLNNIKKAITNEHGADGIIAITKNQEFIFIDEKNADVELGILSLLGRRFNICNNKTAPKSNTWSDSLNRITTAVDIQDES